MVAAIPAAVTLGVTWKAMSGHREEGEGGTEQSTARPGEGGEVARRGWSPPVRVFSN